jgi:hypothetical protein
MDLVSYILSKRYVDETVAGGGALKGAPCEISSIEKVEGGNNITLSWKLTDDSTQTATIFVKDGVDGQAGADGTGITRIEQKQVSSEDSRESLLTIYLSDGTEYSFIITNEPGADGATPEIGENGHWIINGVDTGIVAAPDLSSYYSEANLSPLTLDEIDEICKAV